MDNAGLLDLAKDGLHAWKTAELPPIISPKLVGLCLPAISRIFCILGPEPASLANFFADIARKQSRDYRVSTSYFLSMLLVR